MAEKKFTLTTQDFTSFNPSATGQFFSASVWAEPVQGTTRNSRIGNKIQSTWLTFRMSIRYTATSTANSDSSTANFLVVLFTWKMTPPTTPTVNDILVNDATTSTNVQTQFLNPFDRDKIHVLKSWRFILGSAITTTTSNTPIYPSAMLLNYAKSFKRNFSWENNSTTLINETREPYFAIFQASPSGISSITSSVQYQWMSKMNFIDV